MYVTKCIHILNHPNPHIVRPFLLYITVGFFKTFSPFPLCVFVKILIIFKKKKKKKIITHLINEFN